MKISGKSSVVFGSVRGIGLAYVKALLHKGAKVCVKECHYQKCHNLIQTSPVISIQSGTEV